MQDLAYAEHLRAQYGDKPEELAERMEDVEDFFAFLAEHGVVCLEGADSDTVSAYVVRRRAGGGDINKRIDRLTEYAFFAQNETLATEFVLLRDAWNVMNKMSAITEEHNPAVWRKVFGDAALPSVGSTLDEMSAFTRATEQRMLGAMPREEYEHIMCHNAHSWEPEWNADWRERFLALGSVDLFIETLNQEIVRSVEESLAKNELCFTQVVDEDAVAYAKSHPIYVRDGSVIRAVKIPFMINHYLRAENPKMKRYFYCHCAWIKKSILQAEGPVSRSFCHCSLGYEKKPFDVAFGREISGKVVETVMDEGCLQCRFELEIPEDIMERYVT